MTKKAATREAILQQALALASQVGVSGLTIGSLAAASGLSKSGLFAHFGSKEALYIAVLEAVFANVRAEVVAFDNPLTGGASTCTIYVCDRD